MTQEVTRRSMQGTDGFRPISELAGYSGSMIHVMMQGAGGRDPQTSVTFDGPRL